jgi:antitoxin component YwqK of YwqJK toxin-antitoxin module
MGINQTNFNDRPVDSKGRVHGLRVSKYKNGNTLSETNFNHGIINGVWKIWYFTGGGYRVGNFLNSKLEGEEIICPKI